jgi:Cu-Zn family superoxide dismutase
VTIRAVSIAGVLAGCLALGACATVSLEEPTARVVIRPASGSSVSGQLVFVQTGSIVRIRGELSGHSPGPKGIHIHEKGDCSARDASSAGGHFNPHRLRHGASPVGSHAGDLGNVVFDAAGRATVDMRVRGISVSRSAIDGIIGRAVVVHAQPDDLKTDPTGNAGGRVACGVIAG